MDYDFEDLERPTLRPLSRGPQRYTLWLTPTIEDENGNKIPDPDDTEKVELAQAYGSNFWTELVYFAEERYGKEFVTYTYGQ
jgi:hypothetical protein